MIQILSRAGSHARKPAAWEHLSCPWSLGPRTRGTDKYRAALAVHLGSTELPKKRGSEVSTVFANDVDQRRSMPDKKGPSASSGRGVRWWIVLRAFLTGLVFVLVVSGILIFEFLPVDRIILDEGDVSDSDIRAPREITYVSQILTEEAKDRAAAAVTDIYDPPDARVARQQVTKVRQILDYMDSVRQDSYASPDQQRPVVDATACHSRLRRALRDPSVSAYTFHEPRSGA